MIKMIVFSIILLYIPLTACTQYEKEDSLPKENSLGIVQDSTSFSSFKNPSYEKYDNQWVELTEGVSYIEKTAPDSSITNDSKISILKIDPKIADFEFRSASQKDSLRMCVVDYANTFNYNIVINSGMYNLRNSLKSEGLLINNPDYTNNPKMRRYYNMMICANPKSDTLPAFDIVDLTIHPWDSIHNLYNSFAQGLRMIDGNGKPMHWKNQVCSQLIVAKDTLGMIYFIFNRSPYSQNYMIDFMVNMGLRDAIYMEGGPQASLFVDIDNYRIEKLGSYVSRTYPRDDNAEFSLLPNVIGVTIKKKKTDPIMIKIEN